MLPSTPVVTGDGDLTTGIPACELRKGKIYFAVTLNPSLVRDNADCHVLRAWQ